MAHICLVAGDPSGDAHAAALVTTLRRRDPSLTYSGVGGHRLREAGVPLLDDLTQTAAIGPFDALANLRRLLAVRRRVADHLMTARPEAVVLVDFGDFNLPFIAPIAKRAGCRVIYFISPQLWAWGRFRLRWVRRCVDRMIVVFPFEEAFYRRHGVPVTWVGHPLIEASRAGLPREQAQAALGLNPWRMTVGLLPGSRRHEITRLLPLLLRAARRITWDMPGVQFLLPKAPSATPEAFAALSVEHGVDLIPCENRIDDCLACLDVAIVASGTATLQTALHEVPMVVVYRTSLPTYLAAKAVVRVPHIAMVNLIAGRAIVPECVQFTATPRRIASETVALLRDQTRQTAMREALRSVKEALGPPGAMERAARAVLEELRICR